MAFEVHQPSLVKKLGERSGKHATYGFKKEENS